MKLSNTIYIIFLINIINSLDIELKNEETRITNSIEIKQEKSCMIKIFSKYLDNIERTDEDKELLVKFLAIELTKCLFEINEFMPKLFKECYILNENYDIININNCISTMTENSIIWTTFNGYLNQIGEIIDRNFENIENLKILNEYKDLIRNFSNLMDLIEAEQIKRENLLNEYFIKFNNLIIELELNCAAQSNNYNKNKDDDDDDDNAAYYYNALLAAFVLILALVLISILLARTKRISNSAASFKNLFYSLEMAILERTIAFSAGVLLFRILVWLIGVDWIFSISSNRNVNASGYCS